MTHILIADDEKLIRAGIRKILSDSLGTTVTFTEAKNGLEAYEICQSEQPDVLVTDIRMPGLTGVELMDKVSKLAQKPAIIVLSGFDDFTYAKSAIENGAIAYILKPVDQKELLAAVDKALSNVRREAKQKNEEKLRFLISEGHMGDVLSNDELKTLSPAKNGFYCISLSSGRFTQNVEELFAKIPHYIVEKKRGFVSLIISKDGLEAIKENPDFEQWSVGVSNLSYNISGIRKLKHESFSALLQGFFSPRKNDIFYFTNKNETIEFSEIDSDYEKVIASLDLLNEEAARKAVKKFLSVENSEEDLRAERLFYAYNKIINGLFNRYPKLSDDETYLYLKGLMIENITQAASLEEWKHYVLDYVLYLLQLLKGQHEKYPYITKAIAYITQNYKDDITMATVANYVSMNYTWFSEKFKEQVGINFNDYLKRFRMDQAKRLLEKGTYKVYEVAEKCGFKDVKHFMKTFREMNGMSAGEWARTHSGD